MEKSQIWKDKKISWFFHFFDYIVGNQVGKNWLAQCTLNNIEKPFKSSSHERGTFFKHHSTKATKKVPNVDKQRYWII